MRGLAVLGLAVLASVLSLGVFSMAAASEPPGFVGLDAPSLIRRLGVPDETEGNGVQLFLTYRALDWHRIGSAPDSFGLVQGYTGNGFRGIVTFHCDTMFVVVDGTVRSMRRQGTDCR